MADNTSTIVPMADQEWIQIKVAKNVKDAIKAAADETGRGVGPWLIWLASQADDRVGKATGIKRMSLSEALYEIALQDELRKRQKPLQSDDNGHGRG